MQIKEIASGLAFPEGPIALDDGSILLVEIGRGTLTRIDAAGKVSVVAELGGGPNGAALGPDGAVYVCNNGGMIFTRSRATGLVIPTGTPDNYECGRIERVNLSTGKFERVYDAVDGKKLRGPNDLVFDGTGAFWFTDHGKTYPRQRDFGGVYYAAADGSAVREVVHPLFTANGIGLSPDNQTLYVADTESARVFAFDVKEPGVLRKDPFPAPHGGRLLAAPGGALMRFDSLAVDAEGRVNVATLMHGGITVVSPDGAEISHVPLPDAFTTNICFGGPDMRTAYITLSGTGKLIALDWPVPGLRLHHSI